MHTFSIYEIKHNWNSFTYPIMVSWAHDNTGEHNTCHHSPKIFIHHLFSNLQREITSYLVTWFYFYTSISAIKLLKPLHIPIQTIWNIITFLSFAIKKGYNIIMKLQNIPEIAFVSSHPENVQMHEDQNQEHALPEKRSQTWRSEQDKNYKILFYHFKGKKSLGSKITWPKHGTCGATTAFL